MSHPSEELPTSNDSLEDSASVAPSTNTNNRSITPTTDAESLTAASKPEAPSLVDEDDGEIENAIDENNQIVRLQQKGKPKKNPGRKRHGARNQHRHKFFVKWLVDTFDLQASQIDNSVTNNNDTSDQKPTAPLHLPHILDVAGGKGEVSARLTICHRQRVVMVDPRKADLVHCFETLVLPKIPKKWQQKLEDQRTENPAFVETTLEARFSQLVTTFDEYTIPESPELQEAIKQASLLLGLHADGATEAIVAAALKYHRPFCIVPCCVFPNLFRERRVLDPKTGQMVPVRSHEQFCQYLLDLDPRFRREILPFEGRNVAIWWDGKS